MAPLYYHLHPNREQTLDAIGSGHSNSHRWYVACRFRVMPFYLTSGAAVFRKNKFRKEVPRASSIAQVRIKFLKHILVYRLQATQYSAQKSFLEHASSSQGRSFSEAILFRIELVCCCGIHSESLASLSRQNKEHTLTCSISATILAH